MLWVPILDHLLQHQVFMRWRVGGEKGLLQLPVGSWACCHTPSPARPAPFSISALAPCPLAQPGLDLIDSLWPEDSMPARSTCGRQTGGRGRGRGEERGSCVGQTPTLTRHNAPRPGPDKDTPSCCTPVPMTLVSRIVLNLISQQCPIERECPSPGPSNGTSLGQTSSRKNVM